MSFVLRRQRRGGDVTVVFIIADHAVLIPGQLTVEGDIVQTQATVLDNVEVRRIIEIARREQTGDALVELQLAYGVTLYHRQNRVMHGSERSGEHRRTDCTRGEAGIIFE